MSYTIGPLYLAATDLSSSLTFVATTTRRRSRKVNYYVMPARGRDLDNPIRPRFVPLYFRRAAQNAAAELYQRHTMALPNEA